LGKTEWKNNEREKKKGGEFPQGGGKRISTRERGFRKKKIRTRKKGTPDQGWKKSKNTGKRRKKRVIRKATNRKEGEPHTSKPTRDHHS